MCLWEFEMTPINPIEINTNKKQNIAIKKQDFVFGADWLRWGTCVIGCGRFLLLPRGQKRSRRLAQLYWSLRGIFVYYCSKIITKHSIYTIYLLIKNEQCIILELLTAKVTIYRFTDWVCVVNCRNREMLAKICFVQMCILDLCCICVDSEGLRWMWTNISLAFSPTWNSNHFGSLLLNSKCCHSCVHGQSRKENTQ